jgi:phage repressor protein C with HTH and peptisase S24 domain
MVSPRRIWRAIVTGDSMEPALRAGDRLLVLPAGERGLPGLRGLPPLGSIVVVEREGRLEVKRVARPPDGTPERTLWLLGDNPARSTDSRQFGALPLSALRARVVWRSGAR